MENSEHLIVSIPSGLYDLALKYSKSHEISDVNQVVISALQKLLIDKEAEKMTETEARKRYGKNAFIIPIYRKKLVHTYMSLDEQDYLDFLNKFPNKKLHLQGVYPTLYLESKSKKETISIHRWVMAKTNNLDNLVVDHIDNDPLNNSRTNLRITTKAENAQNVTSTNKLGFIGVTQRGKVFYGRARINKQRHTTIGHETAEAAARARDELIKALGSLGKLNFTV